MSQYDPKQLMLTLNNPNNLTQTVPVLEISYGGIYMLYVPLTTEMIGCMFSQVSRLWR